MKTTNNLLKIILSTGFLFFNVLLVNGQVGNDKDCTCSEVVISDQNELVLIGEDDYPNFLNISDLKKYSYIKYDGIISPSPDIDSYIMKSSNKHATLYATYAKDGKLINGLLVSKNTILPQAILLYLIDNGHKDWTMTSNKTFVHDFDAQKTEYEVKMKKDKNKQVLYFDHTGKPIKKLSRS